VPRIPVILVTAMGDERIAAEVIHRGGADYVIKTPGFWDQLAGALERVLRLSEAEQMNARLAAIVESSDDAIVSETREGIILSWNPGAERLYGYTAQETIGRSVDLLLPPDLPFEREGRRERAPAGAPTRQMETIRMRKDGSRVYVSATEFPIFDNSGQMIGSGTVSRDITERKRLEEQLRQAQKLEAIGQLTGGIAHDFNNIVTVIQGYTGMLLGNSSSHQPGYEELREIQIAGERAADLTRQLLAFSRKQKSLPRILDLNGVVSNLDRMLRRLIGENITLTTSLASNLDPVEADPGQLEQVIVNLVVNARDAMPGGGEVTIETSNVVLGEPQASPALGMKPGPYVRLQVRDTGTGMDTETLSHVFEPFFTTKEPGRGTGLGLATVFGVVKQSGGNVYVESEPGRGSVFKIFLPRAEGQAEPEPLRSEPSPTEVRGGEVVLVVEDDAAVRRLACQILAKRGYAVLEAADPDRGLEIARQRAQRIDLLVSDVVMPQMSGPDLARRVAELRPGTKVLFLSGYAGRVVAEGGLDPNAPFLEKPFNPEDLLKKIREVLGSSGA